MQQLLTSSTETTVDHHVSPTTPLRFDLTELPGAFDGQQSCCG